MVPIRANYDSPITTFGARPAPTGDHWLIRDGHLCPVCDEGFEDTWITMVLVGFRPEDWNEHRTDGKQWGNGGTVIVHAACAGLEMEDEDDEETDERAA